ncbi:MAG: 30S ribosomal protein S6 [Bdellovibrionales bacterium]
MQKTTEVASKGRKSSTGAQKEAAVKAYESVIILNPESALETQKDLFKKNKKIIEEHNGSVHTVETWGKRILANPIEKFARGLYFHTTFYADTKAVAELERTMRINDKVLRFIHTRLEDGTELAQHLEKFKTELANNAQREREREAKQAEKRAAMKRFDGDGDEGGGRGGRGGRDGGRGGGRFEGKFDEGEEE